VLTLAQLGKSFIPGSPWLFLVVVTVGVALFFARAPRIRAVGRLLLAAVAGATWLRGWLAPVRLAGNEDSLADGASLVRFEAKRGYLACRLLQQLAGTRGAAIVPIRANVAGV